MDALSRYRLSNNKLVAIGAACTIEKVRVNA